MAYQSGSGSGRMACSNVDLIHGFSWLFFFAICTNVWLSIHTEAEGRQDSAHSNSTHRFKLDVQYAPI